MRSIQKKARGVLALVKPWMTGYSWSGTDMHTKFTEKGNGDLTIYPAVFHGANRFPVVMGLQKVSKFGPMIINPVQVSWFCSWV